MTSAVSFRSFRAIWLAPGSKFCSEVHSISSEARQMQTQALLAEELSQIISQAVAPAFLLGAIAAFIAVLIGRSNRIADRSIVLAAREGNDTPMGQVKVLTSTFKRRAKLLSRGLEYAVIAAIFITLLVIVAFASVAVGFNEVYGATVMFVLALSFFAGSLICLWLEVRIARGSIDHVF
jgi:Protein of unknown function (DUF2721)